MKLTVCVILILALLVNLGAQEIPIIKSGTEVRLKAPSVKRSMVEKPFMFDSYHSIISNPDNWMQGHLISLDANTLSLIMKRIAGGDRTWINSVSFNPVIVKISRDDITKFEVKPKPSKQWRKIYLPSLTDEIYLDSSIVEHLMKQKKSPSGMDTSRSLSRANEGKNRLKASFQYIKIPGKLTIRYYGPIIDYYVTNNLNISCLFYLSDTSYIHLPLTGIIAWFYIALAYVASEGGFSNYVGFSGGMEADARERVESEEYISALFYSLFFENINYDIHVNNKIMVSPYVSILGAEIDTDKEFSLKDNSIITSGAGIKAEIFLKEGLTISPCLGLNRIQWPSNIDHSKYRYSAGISLGYFF